MLAAPAKIAAPRSAYVHVPFCRNHCGYCNFSVVAGRDDLADAFLDALERELSMLEEPRAVDTIFIGGGTPTHLDAPWIERLLSLVCRWFPLNRGAYEFTIEANPNDVTSEKLQLLHGFGVNRISLGVQSFDSGKLACLERTHSPEQAKTAVVAAHESIGNVSIDLIFAAPNETPDDWKRDLSAAVALPVRHVSTYGLTFEKGSRFWSLRQQESIASVPEEVELQMYADAIEVMTQAGLEQYEVSNFSRDGYQCRHNLAYWKGVGWYAVGPGAASFVDGTRRVNHRSSTTYMRRLLTDKSPVAECEPLTSEQLIRERAAFGLRMIAGIDLKDIGPIEVVEALLDKPLRKMTELGMIQRCGTQISLTRAGLLVSDSVLSEIL